jgi:hypothetical protein
VGYGAPTARLNFKTKPSAKETIIPGRRPRESGDPESIDAKALDSRVRGNDDWGRSLALTHASNTPQSVPSLPSLVLSLLIQSSVFSPPSSDRHRHRDMRVTLIADDFEILEPVVEQ